VAAFLAGRAVLPTPPSFPAGRVDWISAVLVTGGLAAVVFGAGEAGPHGWGAWQTAVPLAVGVLTLALFAVRQARHDQPLLPLRILADRNRAGAYIAVATAVVGAFGVFLTLTYYLQVVAHFSPLRTGLAFLPMAAANSVSGYLVGARLTRRVPAQVLIAGGLLIAAAGLGVLTRLDAGSGYLTSVVPVEVLLGIGMGAAFPPAFSLATAGVSPREAGVAAAVVNAASQIGGSIGTAVVNTVAISATAGYLRAHGPNASRVSALVHGYTGAATVSAIALVSVAALVVLLVRPAPPAE
jgi:predicted MFS family arabinose efflux permease